jgi:PAT family beta-lactamase induction signal transducer AmpG
MSAVDRARIGVRRWATPAMLGMLMLGFSSGLPLLLVFSTLTFWLVDAGIDKSTIGLFALVKTPYTFKFLLAPMLDHLRLPGLARRMGHRRSWTLVAQGGLIAALLALALTQPEQTVLLTAALAIVVALFSAMQDVALDAWRVERFPDAAEQALATSTFVTGYRLAMLVAGAGALWLASHAPWTTVYSVMALLQGLGVLAALFYREAPDSSISNTSITTGNTGTSPQSQGIMGWIKQAILAPLGEFITRPGWQGFVLIALTYKLGDAFLGVMVNPFYVENGFAKIEIAEITKLYGFLATILGAFCGGWLVARWGLYRTLIAGAVLQLASNLSFLWLAHTGHSLPVLAVVVTFENLSGGIGTTAYLTLFAALCNKRYTATQFALLTSLMAFARDLLSAQSGFVADAVSWPVFFWLSGALALPGILLLLYCRSSLTLVARMHHDTSRHAAARPASQTPERQGA